jgi:hypothetical protein
MNKKLLALAVFFISTECMAQVFDKDTIIYNGTSDKLINFVILGDGYTTSELNKFVTDASTFTNSFFSEVPYSGYKKYFNVFIVKVPSNQSGASHPGTATDETEPVFPVATVDNYFGSTFDYSNIHRLLVATKTLNISNVLAANYPNYDQVLILVNSPYYGGSGGTYSVASTHTLSVQIAAHEIGHSFARLKDEYWAGDIYASEGVNMTKETNPAVVKWKNWIGINLIGIYQYCCGETSALWYKPHQNCKMQYLGPPFCSVCVQASVERIHSLVSAVYSFSPVNTSVDGINYPLKFKLSLIAPLPNSLKSNWLLNENFYKHNSDSVFIHETNLNNGINTLKVTIEDTTQLLRVDNHATLHISTVTWTINKSLTGIKDITGTSSEMAIEMYPNPAAGYINIKLPELIKGKIKLEIYDLSGKRLKVRQLQSTGVNSIDLHGLDKGIYIGRILLDNNQLTSRKIIVN